MGRGVFFLEKSSHNSLKRSARIVCFLLSQLALSGCGKNVEGWLRFDKSKSIWDNAVSPTASAITVTGSGPGSVSYLSSSNFTATIQNGGSQAVSALSFLGDSRCSIVSTTCGATLDAGQTCDVVMSFTAADGGSLACALSTLFSTSAGSNSIAKTFQATGTYPGSVSIQKVYPTNGAGWNDYVKRSDFTKSENAQTDTACAVAPTTKYSDCLHGGTKLKVRTGRSSCAGLTITETLGAFQWTCDASSGEAYFFSNQFAMGKGLAHLLNATSWKSNSVLIYDGATQILSTPLTAWWTTPVQVLPDASGSSVTLSTADVIYTHSADQVSKGYTITANKVAIVSLDGAKIIYSSGNGSVILNDSRFHWLEAMFQGGTGIYLASSVYASRIHRSTFTNGNYGVANAFSGKLYGSILSDVRVDKMTATGIKSDTIFTGNLVWNTSITNVGSYCIDAWSAGGTKYVRVLCTNSNNTGIHTKYGGSLAAVSVLNASNMGVEQDYTEANAYMLNSLFANADVGIYSYRTLYNFSQLYTNISSVGNTTADVVVFANSAHSNKNKFAGALIVGSTGCQSPGPSSSPVTGIENATCTTTGTNASSTYSAGSLSTAVLRTGASLVSAVLGQVTDTINPQGAAASTASGSVANWSLFDNVFRGWGAYEAGGNLTAASRTSCVGGSCSIWDFRLSGASPFKYATATGVAGSSQAFVAGAACPAAVSGNTVTYTLESTPRPFLSNAVEIPLSPIGNHDGLCESGEACFYAPNFGADQGLGDFWTNSCTFQNGTITGVSMYAYPL